MGGSLHPVRVAAHRGMGGKTFSGYGQSSDMENNLENLTIGVSPGRRGQCGAPSGSIAQGLLPETDKPFGQHSPLWRDGWNAGALREIQPALGFSLDEIAELAAAGRMAPMRRKPAACRAQAQGDVRDEDG